MAIVYSDNIIEIAVNHQLDGRPCVNVWHMWFDAELGSDTKVAVVEDFRNNWQDHVIPTTTEDTVLIDFEWRSLDSGDASNGVVQPDPLKNTVGSQVGGSCPPNVAYLVHKNTDARPRGRRDGRCFLAGVPEEKVITRGLLLEAFVTEIDGNWSSFYNGVSDTSGAASGDRYPAVLETTAASRAPGTSPVTIASRRVTSITVDPLVATQRDRLR